MITPNAPASTLLFLIGLMLYTDFKFWLERQFMKDDLKNNEPTTDQDIATDGEPKLAELLAAITTHNLSADLNWGPPAGEELW